MSNNLIKESIADANELKKFALENAKAQLIEAFQPRMKSMLAKVIEAEEDPDEDEDLEDTEMDLQNDNELEDELPEVDLEDSDDDEEIDLDLEDDDLEESDDMDSDDEEIDLDLEDEDLGDDEEIDLDLEDDDLGESDDEEIDLDLEDEDLEESDDMDEDDEELDLDLEDEDLEESIDLTESDDEDEDDEELDLDVEDDEDLEEAYKTIRILKNRMHEVNLLNRKLYLSNKIFNKFSTNRRQKMKIIESFDKAKTANELKLVYTTINKQLSEINSKSVAPRKRLKESVSKIKTSSTRSKSRKPILNENTNAISRFQELAGIKKSK